MFNSFLVGLYLRFDIVKRIQITWNSLLLRFQSRITSGFAHERLITCTSVEYIGIGPIFHEHISPVTIRYRRYWSLVLNDLDLSLFSSHHPSRSWQQPQLSAQELRARHLAKRLRILFQVLGFQLHYN